MKKTIHALSILCFSILLISCEETPPYINLEPDRTIDETTYIKTTLDSAEPRAVYIEEVTGVRCPNCPKAQAEAKIIYENNPGRINILTIHPLGVMTALTRPFDQSIGDQHTSKYDLRTDPGARIFEMVGFGQTGSLPIGNINRKLFNGEVHRNIDYPKWSAYVNQELAEPTPVNILLKAKNAGDFIDIELTLTYTAAVSDSQYVTLAISESDIEDIQESKDINGNTIYVEDYIHNHVLRNMVTAYFGDYLNASYVPGRVFYKKYRIPRDPKWNSANLDVLALVHLNTTKKNVLHSKTVKVN